MSSEQGFILDVVAEGRPFVMVILDREEQEEDGKNLFLHLHVSEHLADSGEAAMLLLHAAEALTERAEAEQASANGDETPGTAGDCGAATCAPGDGVAPTVSDAPAGAAGGSVAG